ncbi:carboxylesterase family protein [Halomonas sp. GD1P12]|uniref:carboxylesterase family protein n=1 Tax=Halomonas sp. GD1P12 TaxID=2982691 RepID=UPI0021E4DB1E|nr:carboxylesterase family protein [Halomonas sp. GD1P12]UYF98869.1 carboxylesterase family protein [Halomonas sp. GD1P12]
MTHAEPAPQDTPRFTAPAGDIIGWRDRGAIRATGIRYARVERFCPPVDEPPSSAPIHATEWSPAAPQNIVPELNHALGVSAGEFVVSEEALHLSVTLPESPASTPRPVMVWIHGGSYVFGTADLPVFDTRPLALENDVIVVGVNYRLGLLGFLGGEGRPANLGLLDLISALRWINANIAAFGGDPDNVTLFGHSAGGDAAAHLMIADGAEGLFQRAIIQSAPLGISRGRAKMNAKMFQQAASATDDMPLGEVLALQTKVVKTAQGFGLKSAMPFSTQYGHYPLPQEKQAPAAWQRAAKKIDVFIGTTCEETALFLVMSPGLMRLRQTPLLGAPLTGAMVAATTRKVYRHDAHAFARRHVSAGGNAFVYRFDWNKGRAPYGAAHTLELPLLLGEQASWRDADIVKGVEESELHQCGQRLRTLWADFARGGQLAEKGELAPGILAWWKAR